MEYIRDWFFTWTSKGWTPLWFLIGTVGGVLLMVCLRRLLRSYKRRALTPSKMLFVGIFLTAAVYFLPIYASTLPTTADGGIPYGSVVMNAAQHSLRLFALDGDFRDWVALFAGYPSEAVRETYLWLGSLLYLTAPVLTFGFILSFFKNLSAHLRYFFTILPTHVFSELNERTLKLAADLYNGKKPLLGLFPRQLIVFTDVVDKDDENTLDLVEGAQALGAILFRKDLESVHFCPLFGLRKLHFYLVSDDEVEKNRHAESIIRHYDRKRVTLWVFSDGTLSGLMLATKNPKNIRVCRVNHIRWVVYHTLWRNGEYLFRHARQTAEGKVISAVLVGLGRYGTEMLKALCWYCQLEGYTLKVNVYEKDPLAKETFTAQCPELMDDAHNGKRIPGDAYCHIDIHAGMDVNSAAFSDEVRSLTDATYYFISLGTDEHNLRTATRIRSLCEQTVYQGDGHTPDIETVLYDEHVREAIAQSWDGTRTGATNFKDTPYGIHALGGVEWFRDTVVDTALVDAARRLNWYWNQCLHDKDKQKDADRSFWQHEYNFRSSVARAIHEDLRDKLKVVIPGAEKDWDQRTADEKLAIGRVEHIRWNAYMRSEGYTFNEKRNDMALHHHNLRPVTELDDDTLRKDG